MNVNVGPLLVKSAKIARLYAEGNMNATVRITRPTNPIFNSATGALTENPESQQYSGKARITGLSGPIQLQIGEDQQFYSSCYVSIPLSASPVQVDDIVQITAHPDAGVVGRFFRVDDVEGAGELPVVRRLRVTGVQHSRKQTYTPPSSI